MAICRFCGTTSVRGRCSREVTDVPIAGVLTAIGLAFACGAGARLGTATSRGRLVRAL
ncbi:hypothetical protein GCM10010435_33380 [Winogradskya consettensis]|uniref:Uncharacterized protein n=1 Tax=Winogradskya consettensis TaxID=113560 RepID=A0A919VND6_9ACTN|nr:hypothetical protein Aco04nite_18110 [Actinoplanes consettensis]